MTINTNFDIMPAATAKSADTARPKRSMASYLRIGGMIALTPIILFLAFVLFTNLFLNGLPVGQPAPDFSGTDLQGHALKLSAQRGQAVMLTFWSPECFACRDELPTLQATANQQNGNVVLITVVSHLPAAEVQKFMQAQKLTFPVVVDEAGSIPQQYKVAGIPFTYLINPDGTIKSKVIGAGDNDELGSAIKGWLSACKIDAPCTVKQ
jgi:peroxiredoxin